jgi:hypothetical protein
MVTGITRIGASAVTAKNALAAAYTDAAGRNLNPITIVGDIGNDSRTPGLYRSAGAISITSGDLTLDALGDANAVFIFQIGADLTVTAGRQVLLSGSAKAANVFWQVGTSATLATLSKFQGTIMADQSITLADGAMVLDGRALALNAAVTMVSNTVTVPTP